MEFCCENEDNMCSICFEDLDIDPDIRKLSCGHWFHVNCIKKWLEISSACPFCRNTFSCLVNIPLKVKYRGTDVYISPQENLFIYNPVGKNIGKYRIKIPLDLIPTCSNSSP